MKKTINIIIAGLLSITAFGLSSCLKDSSFVDFSKVGTLVELPLEAFNGPGNIVAESFPIQAAPQTFSLVVNIASPKPLGTALTVTLGVDQAALTAYNHANGLDTGSNTPYILPPTNAFSIPNPKVTIPAGQRTANLTIQVISSNLDPAGQFMIPISIIDGGGQQISNYKTILFTVQAKNQFDGIYALKGVMHRDADATLGGIIVPGVTIPLATSGLTSLTFSQVWANGSGLAGLNPVTIVIDPASNKVTSITSPIATIVSLPGYNNHYDPATKTFFLSIIWQGTDPSHRSATDTLTYSAVRP
jgi:Domain of unknown function (DUF1735)